MTDLTNQGQTSGMCGATGLASEASKADVRRHLKSVLAGLSEAERSAAAINVARRVAALPEWHGASTVMLYLPVPLELDITPLAIRAWQADKTVVVPHVDWDQRRMLPVQIKSLADDMTTVGPGIRQPAAGKPVPLNVIDLILVPGLGFSRQGCRIGRGMGFYDRFLAQPDFFGVTCGLAYEQQVLPELPIALHDMPVDVLVTDTAVRRFTGTCIER